MFCKEHSDIIRKLDSNERYIGAAVSAIVSVWSKGDVPANVHAIPCDELIRLKDHVRESMFI